MIDIETIIIDLEKRIEKKQLSVTETASLSIAHSLSRIAESLEFLGVVIGEELGAFENMDDGETPESLDS